MSIYPTQRTKGQIRTFMADLGKFANFTGQLIENAVREEASLTARAAMKHSPSMSASIKRNARSKKGLFNASSGNGGDGDKKSSQAFGERAVALDILRIVKTVDESLVDATGDFSNVDDYIKWRTSGRGQKTLNNTELNRIRLDPDHLKAYQSFKAIFQGRGEQHKRLDGGSLASWHSQMKKKFNHRIRRNRTKDSAFFNTLAGYRTADERTIINYIRSSQKRVGYLKSGWLACIKQIGPVRIRTNKYPMGLEKSYGLKGLPTFIKRHSAPGVAKLNFPSVYDSDAKLKIYKINIVNMVGNADNAGTTAKTFDKTLAYRTANRKGKMKKYLEIGIQQFNNETNGN